MRDSRLSKIKEILLKDGHVEVTELSEQMSVSAVTIRSDLNVLEDQGFLVRTHGGAVLKNTALLPQPTPEQIYPQAEHVDRKLEIARLAGRHVKENSWVYLSSGTTCIEVAKEFTSHKLNVVTGNLMAAQILAQGTAVQVLVTGGNLVNDHQYTFLRGDWFLRALGEVSVEQAFLSVSGVDFDGYSWGNALECESLMMETIRKVSKEIVVLADSTKFNKRSFLCAEKLDYADTVITNSDIPDEYRRYYEEHQIQLIMPDSYVSD